MGRHVALIRGINVGGKHLVPMPALKAAFEALGLEDVATYIQSGNVLFSSPAKPAALERRLEAALAEVFGLSTAVVVRSHAELRRIVAGAPPGFGADAAARRHDVIFLKAPLTAAEALSRAPVRPGVDEVAAGPGVLFYSRLVAKASQSRMSRIVSMPMYRLMTIRNWNTTTKLLALLEGPGRRRGR